MRDLSTLLFLVYALFFLVIFLLVILLYTCARPSPSKCLLEACQG